jgi:hypothetical protein
MNKSKSDDARHCRVCSDNKPRVSGRECGYFVQNVDDRAPIGLDRQFDVVAAIYVDTRWARVTAGAATRFCEGSGQRRKQVIT